MFGLTNNILAGSQKLLKLNLQTMKSALAETDEPMWMAFAANDPQELLALQASAARWWRQALPSIGRYRLSPTS
ncbi:TIGR01841 family phasin [Cupriavidus sp. CuC1]|uniref:TIGR01841 family phasin n=1 Tax=Cupriavidus sp. CuC1 TaxID=3373131 RepID=UPI0037D58F27